MIFENENEIFELIKKNQAVSQNILKAREDYDILNALVNGVNFNEVLISKFENIESKNRAESRKKHARNVTDLIKRLLNPIENVFSASGGSFFIKNENKEILDVLSNIRDGKNLRTFIKNHFVKIYHYDPNGIIFIEYSTIVDLKITPAYKSIYSIRNYVANGQRLEYLIFEPKKTDEGMLWRVVDDLIDYTILQNSDNFSIVENQTFAHDFGKVPALVISELEDLQTGLRLSPLHDIIDLLKEYAVDKSVKLSLKKIHGVPLHWRVGAECKECRGTKRKDGNACPSCSGEGVYQSKDVSDFVTTPMPTRDDVNLNGAIAGFITPDLETLKHYNDELEMLEFMAQDAIWGCHKEKAVNETATGKFIDTQPLMNRLNAYSESFEYVEWAISEMVANLVLTAKPKNESIVYLTYGKRFILESPDVILEHYFESKNKGANICTLDRLFSEYLMQKFTNDAEFLQIELKKMELEPYFHLSIMEVAELFGTKEALKKEYFTVWYKESKTHTTEDFNNKFNSYYEKLQINTVPENGQNTTYNAKG